MLCLARRRGEQAPPGKSARVQGPLQRATRQFRAVLHVQAANRSRMGIRCQCPAHPSRPRCLAPGISQSADQCRRRHARRRQTAGHRPRPADLSPHRRGACRIAANRQRAGPGNHGPRFSSLHASRKSVSRLEKQLIGWNRSTGKRIDPVQPADHDRVTITDRPGKPESMPNRPQSRNGKSSPLERMPRDLLSLIDSELRTSA